MKCSRDVVLFTNINGYPDAVLSLLSLCPGLLLIEVNPDSDDLLVLSSQMQKVQCMTDLIDIVHQKDTRDFNNKKQQIQPDAGRKQQVKRRVPKNKECIRNDNC